MNREDKTVDSEKTFLKIKLHNLDYISVSVSLALSVLKSIFPGGTGLAGTRLSPFWVLLELRMMEAVVTTGVIRHAKLKSNHHH